MLDAPQFQKTFSMNIRFYRFTLGAFSFAHVGTQEHDTTRTQEHDTQSFEKVCLGVDISDLH